MKVTRLPSSRNKTEKSDSRFNLVDNPELIGICRGVIADGSINLTEAEYIRHWIGERDNLLDTWPASELYALLGKVLEDGALSADEERELCEMLEEVIGDPASVNIY